MAPAGQRGHQPQILIAGPMQKPRGRELAQGKDRTRLKLHLTKGNEWNKRYVWIEKRHHGTTYFCYASTRDTAPEKSIPLESVQEVYPLESKVALYTLDCPAHLVNQAWEMLTEDKRLAFACMDGKRDAWIRKLNELIRSDDGSSSSSSSSDAGSAGSGRGEARRASGAGDDPDYGDFEEDEEDDEDDDDDDDDFDVGDDDDEYDDDEEDDDSASAGRGGGDDGKGGSDLSEKRRAGHERLVQTPQIFLKSLAALAQHKQASGTDITFAAIVTKISSKEKEQTRVVLIAAKAMVVVEEGTLTGAKRKKVPMKEIRGVIEDAKDPTQLAVLWPQGHDWLFRFLKPPGSSSVGAEGVKEAFLAHLMERHRAESKSHNFVLRESDDIKSVIRRAQTEGYLPLDADQLDRFDTAKDANVYPELRANGDAKVHMSDIVFKVGREEETQKMIIVSDLAIYYCPPTRSAIGSLVAIENIERRIALKHIVSILHDGRCHILVRVQEQAKGGDKFGDLFFRAVEGSSLFANFLDRVPDIIARCTASKERPPTKKAKLEEIRKTARLTKKDAIDKSVKEAQKMVRVIGSFGKKTQRGLKTVAQGILDIDGTSRKIASQTTQAVGGLLNVGEDLMRGVEKGVVWSLGKGVQGVSAVGEMAGLTEAGRGLSAALRKAADELRIPLDKLTSNRGNAVFRELSPLPFDPAAAKDEDAGVLSRMARANTKLTSEIGLAQSDKVWLALPCKLCDLMGAHSKVVLLTNLYLFVFSDDEGRPEQALAGRKLDFRLRLLDVACAVTCVRQPEFCALALDSKDRADQLFWVQQDTLRRTFFAHLDRRHRRVKPHSRGGNRKKDELDKRLQWRWCEDIDALRMIVRSDPKDSPAQLELQRGDGDELQVSRTQKLIRLLREYGDSRVAFSKVGTVISPPQKAEPGKPAGAWRARRMIALLTNTALYLIRPSEQLGFEVFRRVELPQISGVVVNERDNDEVVVRIHVLRFRLSLGGEFQRRADHETCISRALQQDLRSHDCFDPVEVREKERDAVVRVILATPGELERESRKQTARLLALPSRMDSALVGAYPGAAVKIDISDCWDMALRIEGGEDFVELLSSERLWWTSHNRPQGEGGHAEGENSNFTLDVLYEPPGAPADKSEAGRFGLLASARFPKVDVAGTKRALGDKEDPARVRRQALRWADRRLKQAVAEGGAELIEYELGRARRLGLTEHNSAQRRVHLHRGARGARGKQSVMGHAQELLNRIRDTESVRSSLQEAIARRHWGEFDRLAKLARDTGLLEPELRIQRHRSFRQGLLWRRLCGKPLDCPSASWVALCRERLTLEEARARCLAEEKFTGYTYKAAGQPGREESLAVTFVGHVAPPADPESPAGAQQEPGRGTGGWAKLRTAQRLARAAGGRLRSGAVSCGGGGPQAFAAFVRSQPWRGREAGMALAEGWTAVVKKEDELAALQRRKQLAQDQARTITRIRKCIPTLVSDSARALDVQAVDELFACARKIGCDEADLRGVNTDLTARVQGANIQRMLEAGADSQPAAAIRLLEQVWRGLPTAADDTDLGAQLAAHREKALTVRRLERKLQLAIMRGQRDRAEELLRAHGEGDLAHVAAQARGELGRLPQRDAVAERVRHMLRMYQRTLSTASSTSCDPQELDRAVGALAELHPQTKEFPSLESQELQTRVLLEGLRMRHAMREMRREHDRQIAERHDRARKAHEERRRQVQERRDLKLMRQKEEEERVARNYRRKAEEFLEDAQDWNRRVTSGPAGIPAGVLQQRRTATDSTRDAVRGARAAGNMHSALTEALEMLDQAVELWDAVHVAISSTQEEREYANLARELSEACNAGDRERVVALVRKNIADGSKTPLREVDIRRIRSQWAQYVQQQQEQSEFIEKLRTAMRERDRHELAKLLREESVLPADHEVMAEARQLSHELDAAHALQHQGSMNMHDMGMRSITGATGLSMCSPLGADNSSSVTPSGASLMQSLRVDPQAEQAKSEEDGGGGDGAFHDSDDEDSAPTPQRSPGHSTFRVPRPGAKERQGSAFAGMLRTTTARTEGDGASVASESPPPVAPDTEPPPGHAVLVKLQEALRQLSSSGDVDPGGLVRCKASNPNVPRYVDAWRQVLKCRLKPAGFFRKQPRDVVDIVSETAKEVWSANQALEAFNVAKKLNNPKGLDVNTFVLHYLMQSGRFYQTVSDILTTPDVLEKLYFEDSIFRTQEAIRFLLRLMKDAKRLRFDFRFILPEEDIQYLEAVDRQAAQEAEAAGAQGRLHSPSASPAAVPSAAPPAVPPPNASGPAADQRQPTLSVTFEDAPGAAERAQQPEEDDEESRALDPRYFVAVSEEFDQANVLGKVSFAVKQLHEYFRASRTRLQRQSAPPGSLTQVFDEPKHGVIGLLARERLCPALCALLRAGFKEEKLFGKRHPWQFIEAAAAQCRSNATDLGGSLLPGAVDCVTAIIDKRTTSSPPASPVGRSKAQFAVLDTKLRTLLCYALNNCHTKAYFETLFDTEQGGKNDFVGEWYVVDQTPLLDKGIRAELDSLLSLLSRIRFQLTLDADVW